MPRPQLINSSLDVRSTAAALIVGLGSLYIVTKLLREIAHVLRPSAFPGEPNTALLATAAPNSQQTTTADHLQDVVEYDYIIVGTGTAGCVLASRLSEDRSMTVLSIESGHSDLKQLFSRIPAAFGRLFGSAADWNLWTTEEAGCMSRKMAWPRGKMLGGCSSINAMIYNRGSPDDYDEFERLGNPGWGFKDVVKFMDKAEKFTPRKGSSLSNEDLSQHGLSGPWATGYSYISGLAQLFMDSCAANGIPVVPDLNTHKGIQGVSTQQTFIDTNGQRSSASVAYLTPDVMKRPNLKIATGQTVTRIIFDTSSTRPRAVGIEMSNNRHSPLKYLAKARHEVILSAGAVHTPHLLKLSGIGPPDELANFNINIVKSMNGVGANLADHLFGTLIFGTKLPSLQYLFHPLKSLPALIEWFRFGTGPMTSNVAEVAGYLRTANRADAPQSLRENDLSSGHNSADLEILGGPLAYIDHGRKIAPTDKNWFSIGPILLRPESRGTVKLASNDPFDPPRIHANYLATQHDRDMIVYGLKLSRTIAKSRPFVDCFDGWYFPDQNVDNMTDEQLLKHARTTCETIYHPMCTAKMGQSQDSMAVVDERLRIHGVDGLRIADASIFPLPIACHPCAPVVAVGEKAADMIRMDHS